MFFISHGSTRESENGLQQFDARTYQWKVIPKDPLTFHQFTIQEKELEQEWLENNCHPNGVFKCNRCYRKHYVPDNFDLLCDGCSSILKEYHSQGLQFEFTERFNDWYTNVPENIIRSRMELRQALNDVYKSDCLLHENEQVIIIRDPLKNNGDIEVCYVKDDITDKKERFIVNIANLTLN